MIAADAYLPQGLVSMAFGRGPAGDDPEAVRSTGSSPSRLVADDDVFDPYTGQPRMSNVPLDIDVLG